LFVALLLQCTTSLTVQRGHEDAQKQIKDVEKVLADARQEIAEADTDIQKAAEDIRDALDEERDATEKKHQAEKKIAELKQKIHSATSLKEKEDLQKDLVDVMRHWNVAKQDVIDARLAIIEGKRNKVNAKQDKAEEQQVKFWAMLEKNDDEGHNYGREEYLKGSLTEAEDTFDASDVKKVLLDAKEVKLEDRKDELTEKEEEWDAARSR